MTRDLVGRNSSLFPALHLLERSLAVTPAIGESTSPEAEAVRFASVQGFSFPPGDLGEVTKNEDGTLRVEVAAMGLVGPAGVMPHWYHELLLERDRAGDTAMADFYDLFNHRLISLFYRAWKRSRLLPQKKPDNNDVFSGHLLTFLGMGTQGLREKLTSLEEALLYFSGPASRQVPTAATIAQIVQAVFGVVTEVEQFVPRTVELEQADRTMLGEANCALGIDAVCGGEICDVASALRLTLGPMGYRKFSHMLEGQKVKKLVSLMRFLAGPEFEFEVRLKLKKEEVPACRLGVIADDAPRLGRSTWIKVPDSLLDADPFVTLSPGELFALEGSCSPTP